MKMSPEKLARLKRAFIKAGDEALMLQKSSQKKKITPAQLSFLLIGMLFSDIDKTFKMIVKVIEIANKKAGGKNILETDQKKKAEIAVFLLALSIIELPNSFQKELATKLRKALIEEFSKKFPLSEKESNQRVTAYENKFYDLKEAGINPLKSFDFFGTLYENLQMEKFTMDIFEKKIKCPNSIIRFGFVCLLFREVIDWEKVKQDFSIIEKTEFKDNKD